MLNKKYSLLLLFLSIIGQTSAMDVSNHLTEILRYIISRSHLQDITLPIEQLCTAICKNDTEKIEVLLTQEVDPNGKSFVGLSPVHYAATTGNLDVCKLLVQYGANPSVVACKELSYETPLHDALAVPIPVNKNHNAVAIYLIKECGVNPNAKTGLHSVALHQAALTGNKKILKLLLQNGAHPHTACLLGSNALHNATIPWNNKSEETIIKCIRKLLLLGVDHKKQNIEHKIPTQYAETKLVQKILENDESVKKFMISNTTLHGKNMYKELMNRQINPRQMNPHKQELMNRYINSDKQPMHVTKFNLEQTKTLFLGNGQAK